MNACYFYSSQQKTERKRARERDEEWVRGGSAYPIHRLAFFSCGEKQKRERERMNSVLHSQLLKFTLAFLL